MFAKSKIITVFLSLAILPNSFVASAKGSCEKENAILFYSDKCPHCQTVQKFIEHKHCKIKLSIEQKNICHHRKNRDQLISAVKNCHITSRTVELPVLCLSSKCFIGEDKIVNFLKEKMDE